MKKIENMDEILFGKVYYTDIYKGLLQIATAHSITNCDRYVTTDCDRSLQFATLLQIATVQRELTAGTINEMIFEAQMDELKSL